MYFRLCRVMMHGKFKVFALMGFIIYYIVVDKYFNYT